MNPPAFVQTAKLLNQLGVSPAPSFASNPVSGNTIFVIAFCTITPPANLVSTITTPNGDNFVKQFTSAVQRDVEIWKADNIKGGANSKTVTVNFTGAGNPGVGAILIEVSGGPFTLNATNSANSPTNTGNPSAGSITPKTNDFCIMGIMDGSNGNNPTGSWNALATNTDVGWAAYQIAAGGAITGNATNANLNTWDAIVASFTQVQQGTILAYDTNGKVTSYITLPQGGQAGALGVVVANDPATFGEIVRQ